MESGSTEYWHRQVNISPGWETDRYILFATYLVCDLLDGVEEVKKSGNSRSGWQTENGGLELSSS
jgi:hypothetical protein